MSMTAPWQYTADQKKFRLYRCPESFRIQGSFPANRLRKSDLLEGHRLFLWNGGIYEGRESRDVCLATESMDGVLNETMSASKIMLIRHSEKPAKDGTVKGVSLDGAKDKESLSVRGWQRAGALVRFFAPHHGHFAHPALAKPGSLFACKALADNKSLRPQHTLVPLAEFLGANINAEYAEGDEKALTQAALAVEGIVLISWKHNMLPTIANEILADNTITPQEWPIDCFNVVWVFDRYLEGWTFTQVPQSLLAGDSEDVIR